MVKKVKGENGRGGVEVKAEQYVKMEKIEKIDFASVGGMSTQLT